MSNPPDAPRTDQPGGGPAEPLPPRLEKLLAERDSAALLVRELPRQFPPRDLRPGSPAEKAWETIGLYHMQQRRPYDALAIFAGLYEQMLRAQEASRQWMPKGMPLVWMSDCYSALGFPLLAKRYLMLTLCEDAIRDKGEVPPHRTGSYFRLVWKHGLSDSELRLYAEETYAHYKKATKGGSPGCNRFPEAALQRLDQNWMTEFPAPREAMMYPVNRRYIQYLYDRRNRDKGRALEQLAEYLLSAMPGCKTTRRRRSPSTDYDVVCAMTGFDLDFRSELGRYFVCECKDWKKPADFTAMAKFCRVLDSVKARFGILFSAKGISGRGQSKYAEREQLKVFHDRGVIIVVVDESDIKRVLGGANFIHLLRDRYERVRLDLPGPT